MLNSPELVILDEPSLGLDPVGMVEVRELVKAIAKEGMTVFVSSHLLFEVEQVCTHVTIINRGNMLVSDTLQSVSSMLSGPAAILVEVAKLSTAVVNAVKTLPFVSSVTQDGDKLTVRLTTREDVRAEVSQQITSTGGTIVGMSTQGSNLEEVFLQLITKDGGGKPQSPTKP